jgi:epoxyqueuosine reductase
MLALWEPGQVKGGWRRRAGMVGDLTAWAENRGWAVALGPARVADETRSELAERTRVGELEAVFAETWLKRFDLPAGASGTPIVIAVPRPAHRIRFRTPDGDIETIVPPTYVGDPQTEATVRRELEAFLGLASETLRPLEAPLKAVAVRLGLARYGRNNIAYVPGMGSYFQLVGALTDLALELPAGWEPHEYWGVPECESCEACGSACPTGAICEDRFLLHAERCLTYFNERPGLWPAWLPSSVHHCLVGCLYCQDVCPLNAGRLTVKDAELVFDLEESSLLIADGAERSGPVWDRIWTKVAQLGLQGYETTFGRNLRALLVGVQGA